MKKRSQEGSRMPEFFLGGYDPEWVKERRLFPPAEYLQRLVSEVNVAKDTLTAIQLDPTLRPHAVIATISQVERALNPELRPWADPERKLTTFAFWPVTVSGACRAIRGRMDQILTIGGMEWVCDDSMPNGWDIPGGNWQDFLGRLQGHLDAIHQAASILSTGLANVLNPIGRGSQADQETGYLGIFIDPKRRTISRPGVSQNLIEMTPGEWEVTEQLFRARGSTVAHATLQEGGDYRKAQETLRGTISDVRAKLKPLDLTIKADRSIGYRLLEI